MGNPSSKVKRVENSGGLLTEPPDGQSVSKEWVVGELMKTEGAEQVDVADVTVEELNAPNIDGEMRKDGGGNSGSRIVRLRLTYTEGGRTLPGGADTLIMKWTNFKKVPSLPFTLRVAQVVLFKVNQADLFRTEAYFMSQVKEVHTWGLKTPTTYVTAFQDATEPSRCCRLAFDSRSKLITSCIMEDIGHYKTPACPFACITDGKARGAMMNIARLHRATWGKQAKYTADLHSIYGRNGFATSHIGLYGLKGSGVFKKKANFGSSGAPEGLMRIWGINNKTPGTDKGLLAIKKVADDKVLKEAFTSLQQNWKEILPKLGSTTPQCMVHGDFHHWNNMYGETDDDVMVIDWQYFGAGRVAYELIYFMDAGVDPMSVAADEALLLDYYNALTSTDLPGQPPRLTFAELVSDYRHAIVDAAVTMCLSLGTRTMGVSYTPKDYKSMSADPKQHDFVAGGMLLSERLFQRLMQLHTHYGSAHEALKKGPLSEAKSSPLPS